MYLATINVPGYLPMDDDPPTFETAREAWEHLRDERERAEDEDERAADYSNTWDELRRYASPHWLVADYERVGTVYGNTPGYEGDHDLGLAYSVTWITEEHEWHRAPFTGAVTCERCGLLPLDDDDTSSPCPGTRNR